VSRRRAIYMGVSVIIIIVLFVLTLATPLTPFMRVEHGIWGTIAFADHKGSLTLRYKSLKDKVTVIWDSYGVPHIFASNEHDLYFASGFIQAMDRLWQMDLTRRLAEGRLSEILGNTTYETDVFYRTIGLGRAAELTLKAMENNSTLRKPLEALIAFTDGVNTYINQAVKTNRLPVEYRILGVKPEPWKPVDSLAIAKLIAWGLAGSFDDVELKSFLDAAGYDTLVKLKLLERPLNTPILGEVKDAIYPRKKAGLELLNPLSATSSELGSRLRCLNTDENV